MTLVAILLRLIKNTTSVITHFFGQESHIELQKYSTKPGLTHVMSFLLGSEKMKMKTFPEKASPKNKKKGSVGSPAL
jgi:hypothetical protein